MNCKKPSDQSANPGIHSKEYDQFIRQDPGYLIRWSTAIFISIAGMLLALTWFITYPKTLTSPLTLRYYAPDGQIHAYMYLPGNKSLMPLLSHPVVIRLDSMPATVYGSIIGNISAVQPINSKDDLCLVRIDLVYKGKTTTGRQILLRPGWTGTGEMTVKSRLLYKLLGKN